MVGTEHVTVARGHPALFHLIRLPSSQRDPLLGALADVRPAEEEGLLCTGTWARGSGLEGHLRQSGGWERGWRSGRASGSGPQCTCPFMCVLRMKTMKRKEIPRMDTITSIVLYSLKSIFPTVFLLWFSQPYARQERGS